MCNLWKVKSYTDSREIFEVENVLEKLDIPGERYLDKSTGKCYYYPFPEEKIEETNIIVPVPEQFIRLEGDPLNQQCVKNIFKNVSKTNLIVFVFLLLTSSVAFSQTTINSLSELLVSISEDNVNARMTPGTYQITTTDFGTGKTFSNPTLFNFTGSNCSYDFTGVTFEIATEVFQAFGNVEVIEVALWGSNTVVKNLTLIDIGNTRPYRTALGVLLDGSGNRVEGFHMTLRGSYPYAYGDIFGKGSGYVIKHYKHSAILVRGDNNTVKNCTIIHRAYGHGIFCQGSLNALIEGCYVEGEMRTTDAVLAEAGTGSPADNVNFMSVWGYKVPAGFMFSLQEDGIRAYNTGPYYLTGLDRNTENMRVINCTVKNMRSGVTIGFCNNTKYVEGCTVLGCENGYSVGAGAQIVNCSGDAKYGPLYCDDYQTNKNNTVDLKVLNNDGAYGNDMIAYIGGSGHNITFTDETAQQNPDQALHVMLSGIRTGLRFQTINPTYNDFTSSLKIYNRTNYPIILASKSSNCTGESGGNITNTGTNNNITNITVVQTGNNKQNQIIAFPALPAKTIDDIDFAPGATSYSGLTVAYISSNTSVATIVSGKIHIVSTGTATITASQAGDTNFNAAPDVPQILTVSSGTTFVGSNINLSELNGGPGLHPNPVSDILNIELADSKTASINIVNNMGITILSTNIEGGKGIIDVSGLSSGMYIVKITNGQKVTNRKILKK